MLPMPSSSSGPLMTPPLPPPTTGLLSTKNSFFNVSMNHLPGAALNDIIVDSAATSHMFNTLEGLFMRSPCNTTVRLADGSAV